jgi:hypothetical protein
MWKQFFNRRQMINRSMNFGLIASVSPLIVPAVHARPAENIITEENRKAGTTDWQLTFVKSENFRSRSIEGYCSKTSVAAGEELDFFISTSPGDDVDINFFRMGYYGGTGGRWMKRAGPIKTKEQQVPPRGDNRLRECAWEKTYTLKIPFDWVSGVYLAKLSGGSTRYQSYIIFVVRDNRKADIVFQTSDTTWQAYNKWPENDSLYDHDDPEKSVNASTWVSYDRPYGKYPQVVDQPLSQGSGEFIMWEFPLCFWLEQRGYDVTYISNIDTHADVKNIMRSKCFFSVGHDEYWSAEMYEHVKSGIEAGVNVAFLSANSVYTMIPLDKVNGRNIRSRIIYRQGFFGGFSPGQLQSMPYMEEERWEKHGPDESMIIGARTMIPFNGSGNWTVTNATHWLFEGTGMKNGDYIPGLVGWEHHGDPAKIRGIQIIASGSVANDGEEHSDYAATIYPGPKGNWVFNAATIYWSLALSQPPGAILPCSHFGRPHGTDKRVQKIMENYLKRCKVYPRK